ncbi:L-aspartate oxidase [bacterium]|nr:L-aspartate oxidase [bacterium]
MSFETDFLIIGSGIAGLTFALKASTKGKVTIVTKKRKKESSTNYAQGGIATVLSPLDSFENHVKDTLDAGAGLCDKKAVDFIVKNGPEVIEELINLGVNFTKEKNSGNYDLGREGGHSHSRVIHSQDFTGKEIERALISACNSNSNIKILENHLAFDLLTDYHLHGAKEFDKNNITCYGAYVWDSKNSVVKIFRAKFIILASGGMGKVYLHTTNPEIATGDGVAIAYRAGAKVANLEFMQFHPTSLYAPNHPTFLISEAVRGFGGILKTADGKTFMEKYSPTQKSLAPRDIVARAIDAELKKRGDEFVYLDVTHLPKDETKRTFPNIYKKCKELLNLDFTKEKIPVVPSAHYQCGGIITNLKGETNIKRLYACGEVACTGLHGANRLASNSLLEALVLSKAIYQELETKNLAVFNCPTFPEWSEEGTTSGEELVLISHNIKEIKTLMWDYVGIVRSNLKLERAQKRIKLIKKEVKDFYNKTKLSSELLEVRNLIACADLIVRCAKMRTESRGLNFNIDFPNQNEKIEDSVLWRFDAPSTLE